MGKITRRTKYIVIAAVVLALAAAAIIVLSRSDSGGGTGVEKDYASYEKAEVIVLGYRWGWKGASKVLTALRFVDNPGRRLSCELDKHAMENISVGDTIVVYYNPAKPDQDAKTEEEFRKITGL